MKVTGLIAEFNPFHNGHEYILKKGISETDADYCIVVLSGDFTQRGTPAVCDKHLRAFMALKSGADVVIELPARASTASAEYYASSGIFLLDSLSVVTDIVFGTEYSSLDDLSSIADMLLTEPGEFKQNLKDELKKGLSYPTARSNALLEALPDIHELQRIMSFPNDILAVEYLKAIKRLGSKIVPHPVMRLGAGYHDNRIGTVNSSALAIRSAIKDTGGIDSVKDEIPEHVFSILKEYFGRTLPVFTEDFSEILRYSLLSAAYKKDALTGFADVSKSLASRIEKKVNRYKDFESFIRLLKTKDMTWSRISRALLHILLHIKNPEEALNEDNSYIRILGFRESATYLIKEINKNCRIPVISRLSDGPDLLGPKALETFNNDLFASDIYNGVIEKKFGTPIPKDMARKLVKKDGIFISL